MAEPKKIKLIGVNELGVACKTNEADKVFEFRSEDSKIIVSSNKMFPLVRVTTSKGSYSLAKHETQNKYVGECANVKVHVVLKKVVGHLTYWG